jgi:hypothetical protein
MSEVLGRALDARLEDLHVAMPAKVVRYDAAAQQVDVQPLVKGTYLDEQGNRVAESMPVVPCVPVLFPGAGGFRVTFPVTVGDTVLLVFSETSLDTWLQHGDEVDPADERRHHLSDAIAIPGLRDFAHALSSAPTDRMTAGYDTGPQVHLTQTEVQLGGHTGLEKATLGDSLVTFINELKVWLEGLATAPVSGGATVAYLSSFPTIPTLVSDIVKVKP